MKTRNTNTAPKANKTRGEAGRPLVFPVEELHVFKLGEWIVFHRQSSVLKGRGLFGENGEIVLKGVIIRKDQVATPATIQLKAHAAQPIEFSIPNDNWLRWIQAGVIIGERFTIYETDGEATTLRPGRREDSAIATLVWQSWREWMTEEFQADCKERNILLLNAAAESLRPRWRGVTTGALRKHLKRLGLSMS